MLPIELGTWLKVISFKHDGSFHRCWDKTCFIEETDEYVVVANSHTSVNESDGRYWQAKDPAIFIYFKIPLVILFITSVVVGRGGCIEMIDHF